MNKWLKRFLFLAIPVALFLLLRYVIFRPEAVEITVYKLQRGKVEETVTNSKAGTVKVRQRAKLSPEIGGRVVYIGAREGERVEKGQVLLRLESSDLRAQYNLAQQAAAAANATMKEACVTAELAERDLRRNRQLAEEGVISASVLDQSENRRDAASARCQASRSEAKRAQAAIQVAKANLEKAELRAPFSGILVDVSTELGEWVTPSPPGVPIPAIMDMLDETGIYVEAPIDETDAGRLKPGLPVRISLDPYPDQHFQGTLTRVASFVRDIEGQNRTVDVEAEFTDEEFSRTLLPGTSADVEVILDEKENVLRIPTHALLEGNRVLLISEGMLVSKQVKTGIRNWEFVEITEGLKEGDRIAVSLDRPEVKEGARVQVTGEVER